MPCNVVLVSAVQQCESAISPSLLSLCPPATVPPSYHSRSSQSTELTSLGNTFPLAVYFTYSSVYMPMLLSQFVPSSPSSLCHKSILIFASAFLSCRYVHQYHFSRFHTYMLIYRFVFLFLTYFPLYDRL